MHIGLILSGGIGSRMGADRPKQYLEIKGRPIISYTVEKLLKHPMIDKIIIAANESWIDYINHHLPNSSKDIIFSTPGATREHTIYNGLKTAKSIGAQHEDIIVIHDGVRPMVSERVITDCIEGCEKYDAAIATVDVKDTIYMGPLGECISGVPVRSSLRAGQTPEAFKLGKFLQIHEDASDEEICNVTGGAQFAFKQGLKVFLSRGEEINFKLTTPQDLERFKIVVDSNE